MGRAFDVHFLSEAVYRSNLNQMFVLGRHDPALFVEAQDLWPHTRAFLLRPGNVGHQQH